MRRLTSIAAFALFLSAPLWAQHGGGGHSSGGHFGGFSSGHSTSSHVGSGHNSGGMHSSSGTTHSSSHGATFSHRGFNRPFLHDGFRGNRFRTYGFRNNCYGYGCGYYGYYPWAYGFYDPYWYWDNDSYDDTQNVAAAAEMNRQNLEEQRMLRQEESDGDQDAYADSPRAPRSMRPGYKNQDAPPAAIMPSTILVFRDQHKQEVSNYAIVGQTLYNFAPQHTLKIPLSDLDLPATIKANDEQGTTFRVPGSGEAQ